MVSHLKQIVEPNMGSSLGLFVAASEPCIGIAADPPAKGRLSRRLRPQQLQSQPELPRSFAVAVVLCPGDHTGDVAAFAQARKIPMDRFYFFYTANTDVRKALAAWTAARHPVSYSFEIHDWQGLNKKFGAFWNAWVHDDHCTIPGCRMR